MATQNIRRNRGKGPTVRGRQWAQPQKGDNNVAYGMMAFVALLALVVIIIIAVTSKTKKNKKNVEEDYEKKELY